jgi:hypothetical protein
LGLPFPALILFVICLATVQANMLALAGGPSATFVGGVEVDANLVIGQRETRWQGLCSLGGGARCGADWVLGGLDVLKEQLGVGVDPIKGVGGLLVLPEVGNDVCHNAFPFVFSDGGVADDLFDMEEYGRADSGVVDIVEASNGPVDGECVDEVFDGGEVLVEGGGRIIRGGEHQAGGVVNLDMGSLTRSLIGTFL